MFIIETVKSDDIVQNLRSVASHKKFFLLSIFKHKISNQEEEFEEFEEDQHFTGIKSFFVINKMRRKDIRKSYFLCDVNFSSFPIPFIHSSFNICVKKRRSKEENRRKNLKFIHKKKILCIWVEGRTFSFSFYKQ